MAQYIASQVEEYIDVEMIPHVRTEFRSAAEKEAYFAHLAPDDPVRRQIGGFDFPNILDETEAGYR